MEKVIKVPDSWEEVSIGQFQEIYSISEDNKNKALEIVSILINEDVEEIRKYDVTSLTSVLKAVSWANDIPKGDDFKRVIEIDGIEYGFINKLSDLSVGEWIDLEGYLEDSILNLHKIAAILYRPIIVTLSDTKRIIEDYDTTTADARADLFKDKMNVGDMYGAMVFFCLIEKNCIKTIQDYFLEEIIRMKLKQKQKQIEKLGWLKRLKQKSGLGTLMFTVWLRETSRKLRGYSN